MVIGTCPLHFFDRKLHKAGSEFYVDGYLIELVFIKTFLRVRKHVVPFLLISSRVKQKPFLRHVAKFLITKAVFRSGVSLDRFFLIRSQKVVSLGRHSAITDQSGTVSCTKTELWNEEDHFCGYVSQLGGSVAFLHTNQS